MAVPAIPHRASIAQATWGWPLAMDRAQRLRGPSATADTNRTAASPAPRFFRALRRCGDAGLRNILLACTRMHATAAAASSALRRCCQRREPRAGRGRQPPWQCTPASGLGQGSRPAARRRATGHHRSSRSGGGAILIMSSMRRMVMACKHRGTAESENRKGLATDGRGERSRIVGRCAAPFGQF
jgi:hypothetical protein